MNNATITITPPRRSVGFRWQGQYTEITERDFRSMERAYGWLLTVVDVAENGIDYLSVLPGVQAAFLVQAEGRFWVSQPEGGSDADSI